MKEMSIENDDDIMMKNIGWFIIGPRSKDDDNDGWIIIMDENDKMRERTGLFLDGYDGNGWCFRWNDWWG